MTRTRQNAQVEQVAENENTENTVINVVAVVDKVIKSDALKRIGIVTDKEFKGYNQKGEEVTTNVFRLNSYTLAEQVKAFAKPIKKAVAYSMGKPIQDELFSLVLQDAEIEFTRTWHDANELREELDENGNQMTYGKPTWTTEITKVTLHIDPDYYEDIKELVKPKKEPQMQPQQVVNINPFI